MKMKKGSVFNLVFSGVCVALAYVLPFLTGQIPEFGSMLCPMHFPILICGLVCGAWWGALAGAISPLLRSLTLGAPTLYPRGIAMAFELCAYGFFSGLFSKLLPKKKGYIYVSQIAAMVAGRIIAAIVKYALSFVGGGAFTVKAFIAGSVIQSLPGIVLQIVLVPVCVIVIDKVTANNAE